MYINKILITFEYFQDFKYLLFMLKLLFNKMFSFYNKVLRAKYKLNNILFDVSLKVSKIVFFFNFNFLTLKNNTIYNFFNIFFFVKVKILFLQYKN